MTGLRGFTLPVSGPALLAGELLLCSFLWGSSFLLMKVTGADIPPVALAALRGVMGAGLLALWLLARGRPILPRGREWRDWIVLGIFQGVIPNPLTIYALGEITTGLTSMIQASSPLMVAMLAHLLFAEERLTWRRGLGVLVGFAGMALLVGPSAFGGGSASLPGCLAMLGAAASYAVGSIYVRTIPQAEPVRLALGQQVFSGLPMLVAVLVLGGFADFAAVPQHALSLAALGLFATALPIVLYMHILRTAGPTRGSMNGYLVPIWTLLLGAVLLGETVSLNEVVGGVVVLTGVALVSLARSPLVAAPRAAA